MWLIRVLISMAASFGLVRLAIKAFRRFSESGSTLNNDPAKHTKEQIKRSMESYWKKNAYEQAEFLLGYAGPEEAETYAEDIIKSMEVVSVQSHDGDRAVALVSIPSTDSDTVPEVVLVECVFRNGLWEFRTSPEDPSLDAPDVLAAIGEPVTLHTGHKEPPFAITVLGLPEPVNDATVRVPVRITCVIPRWSYNDIGAILAFLYTDSTGKGGPVQWVKAWDETTNTSRKGRFQGVTLALGGTHDSFLYFNADDESPDQAVPEQPFVALEYLDATETIIRVDLSRRIPPPKQTQFGGSDTLAEEYVLKIMKKLRESGQWEEASVPPAAKIGDTLNLSPNPDSPWLKMVVLSPPENVSENAVRLRIRITAEARSEKRYAYFPLQVSTKPDIKGRIHHLWESAAIDRDNPEFPDSLHGIALSKGESAEGYVYFRSEYSAGSALPQEPFATLWYGSRLLELPVDLRTP